MQEKNLYDPKNKLNHGYMYIMAAMFSSLLKQEVEAFKGAP